LDRGPQALTEVRAPAAAADLGHPRQLRLELTRHRVGPRAELAEDRADHALALLEQGEEQVLGLHRLVLVAIRHRLRGLEGFLRLDRELVQSHRVYPCAYPLRGVSLRSAFNLS